MAAGGCSRLYGSTFGDAICVPHAGIWGCSHGGGLRGLELLVVCGSRDSCTTPFWFDDGRLGAIYGFPAGQPTPVAGGEGRPRLAGNGRGSCHDVLGDLVRVSGRKSDGGRNAGA